MELFEEITHARKILGVAESATLKQIQKNYRDLVKKWHPDRCREKKEICREKTSLILQAYKTIRDYCNNYRFTFSREEIEKYMPDEEVWIKKYGSDPIWGRHHPGNK